MLTPVEIQNRVFKSGGLGYDKKDVDAFMREIVESYEMLYREKMELTDRVNVLNDALQNYKTIEKTMQRALLLAQKTADETLETARKNAHVIEKEAMTKAELALNDASKEFERVHQKTVELCQQYERYKVQFKNLAAAQIELLETESFQLHMMEIPKLELNLPQMKTMVKQEPGNDQPEELPKIDINFTNAAAK